jgi:6-phospho-beta-glucosidase
MLKHLTVLGGSTPFTAALVDALAIEKRLAPHRLVLHGRNRQNLAIVNRYAAIHLEPLGWKVAWTTDLAKALTGSQIILHQIRYGDLQGRMRDEALSTAAGILPDETLGPGALQAALRQRPHLDLLAQTIRRLCPDAWLLNLTNPLSLVVSYLAGQGLARCIGLCELPRVTVRQAAAVLKKDVRRAQWAYTGLNHRGFVVGLAWDGRDHIAELAQKLGEETLAGIRGAEMISLGAIPTKYFRLYHQPRLGGKNQGRGAYLADLRQRIGAQLQADPDHSPIALQKRYMAWYPDAVVPMIRALSSPKASLQELNRTAADDVTEEGRAYVSQAGIGGLLPVQPGPRASEWLDRIRQHEKAVLAAMARPNPATIACALALDPMVPPNQIAFCSQQIRAELGKRSFAC